MYVLVVAPAIHPPFVPLFVVPNNVVFFLGAALGGVHPLVPYEMTVEPVIGLDLAEHNVAGEDFRQSAGSACRGKHRRKSNDRPWLQLNG